MDAIHQHTTWLESGRTITPPTSTSGSLPLLLLGQQRVNEVLDARLAQRQGLVGGGVVEIVNVPIGNAIRPGGELHNHDLMVFDLPEGNDEIGVFKVQFRKLNRYSALSNGTSKAVSRK